MATKDDTAEKTTKAIWSFDTFNFKRDERDESVEWVGETVDIEFRYLFHRTLNLMLVNIPLLLLRNLFLSLYHNR